MLYIYINVVMIVEVVSSSLYNSFVSHTETFHESLHLSLLNLS